MPDIQYMLSTDSSDDDKKDDNDDVYRYQMTLASWYISFSGIGGLQLPMRLCFLRFPSETETK